MAERRAGVWILGDQLMETHPAVQAALKSYNRNMVRVILIESKTRARKFPYHCKKQVLLFSAMRHYAAELHQSGYVVDLIHAPTFIDGLQMHMASHQPEWIYMMEANSWHGRQYQMNKLATLLGRPVTLVPNTQFLTAVFNPYPEVAPDKRIVMEYFYRKMRRHFSILMTEEGEPVGGNWNYDKQNRKALPSNIIPPSPCECAPDSITKNVMAAIQKTGHGVGSASGFTLAVTRHQALNALEDFIKNRLVSFGPYEDAMSSQHPILYHSMLSPYLNIGLIQPFEVIKAVVEAYEQGGVTINSAEGVVRQVLGWREYINWQYWRLMPDLIGMNFWNATRPLPAFFWDADTDLNCLHIAISRALETGYNHHIERLMLISNFLLMAGVLPRAIHDWFLTVYVDAFDWVMTPNVMGMGLNADGGHIATKPYIASAKYIHRMSDYCESCRYNCQQRTGPDACPFNYLYWNFLIEHEEKLRRNPRYGRNVLSLRYLDAEEQKAVQKQTRHFFEKSNYIEQA